MAGGGGESTHENPLPINVVPLIDVIFCLLLFFLCSFHFRRLEGRMDAWLPKDRGEAPSAAVLPRAVDEIRVDLATVGPDHRVVRRLGRTEYADDAEFLRVVAAARDGLLRLGERDPRLTLGVSGDVPWDDVFRSMDLASQAGVARIQFALAPSQLTIPEPTDPR